jgi:hypothetical protein
MRVSRLVLGVVFVVIALFLFRQVYLVFSGDQVPGNDFRCYYTAAWLVRDQQSSDIYLDSENHDPSTYRDHIGSGTAVAKIAADHRIYSDVVWPYTYPPTLADLLVPLTFLSPSTALILWYLLYIPALIWAGVLLVRLPGISRPELLWPTLAFLLFPPTMNAVVWGQVVILLFLALVAGIGLYARQRIHSAAFLIALTIAIKLTPLILVIPLIAWRDWKMLRSIASWGADMAAAVVLVNGWHPLQLYFFHEMPRIGSEFYIGNRSLAATIQVLWFHTQSGTPAPDLVLAGKLISLLVLCYAGWIIRAKGEQKPSDGFRVESIAYFLLLSCCISPLSWVHAYLLGAPALVFYGKRIWDDQASAFEGIVFLLLILSLATNTVLPLVTMTPLFGMTLGLLGLRRLKYGQVKDRVSLTLAPAES